MSANKSLTPTTSMPNITQGFGGGAGKLTDTIGDISETQIGARQYSSELGRFLQTDPVAGGNTHAYNYPNDPINTSDWSGKYVTFLRIEGVSLVTQLSMQATGATVPLAPSGNRWRGTTGRGPSTRSAPHSSTHPHPSPDFDKMGDVADTAGDVGKLWTDEVSDPDTPEDVTAIGEDFNSLSFMAAMAAPNTGQCSGIRLHYG